MTQHGSGSKLEHTLFRSNFSLNRILPENLKILDKISENYYWSWTSEGTNLFRDLDSLLWDKYEQNPRKMLTEISDLTLWQKANEPAYVERVNNFATQLKDYLAETPKSFGKITTENPAAYFCAEYGVHNSLPIYSGGLGILAGDHLKSASDLNVPLVAIGLFYRYGYFRQNITHDGWQEERYQDAFGNEIAVTPVLDENGERLQIYVHMRKRDVYAQVWLAKIGRISLYLLDTNVASNQDVDRFVTGHLYGGDQETRIVQEKILGMGGVRLLRRLGINPSVYHLNEGHSAFLTTELAKVYLTKNPEATFADAVADVRPKCVFTTHTPVSAGNDLFPADVLLSCFKEDFPQSLRLTTEEFLKLGRINPEDASEGFGMTPLAIKMCHSANGVSEKHGEVSRQLWLEMFPGKSEAEVPITFVTNGVHPPTWIAPTFKTLFTAHIGENWLELTRNEAAWGKAVEKLPDAEIWNAHQLLKNQLIALVRERTFVSDSGHLDTIHERVDVSKLFRPEVLTIGFARRVAAYKRWNLLLSDIPRLYRMIESADRPIQFVFAGKSHPQDRNAKFLLQKLLLQNGSSTWQNSAAFIEDYDQEVARYLVQGVDVWLNVPRRPLEASGTSGEKVAMNGGLNLSILDGWWIEGIDDLNGFGIGVLRDEGNLTDEEIDAQDADSLYSVLENEVIPAYYSIGQCGLREDWIRRMRRALQTLIPKFSSDRMLKDYIEKIYN